MRRYFKYIFLTLITVIFAASCIEEMESPQPMPQSDALTLVPRVKSFTNQYVTKAGEDEIAAKERTISKLSVFVFDNNNNLVHITKEASSTGSIDLNKSMLKNLELSSATIVMLANVELTNVKKTADHSLATEYTAFTDDDPNTAVTLTPADLVNYSLYIPNNQSVVTDVTSSDFKGFPMIGRSKADLSSSSKIEVGLKILYAKVNFEISVSEGGENQKYGKSDNEMTFSLNSCKVFNTSKQTSIAYPTEKDNPEFEFWGVAKDPAVNATSTSATVANHENLSGFQVHAGGKADLGNVSQNTAAKKIAFTFYMSENRFNPNSDLSGVYPSDLWLSSTEYDEYKQHYKPQVAAKSGGSPVSDDKSLATYVVLNGTYVDYRGTSWTVDYTVHLGKDNYQNFQVDRNSEYTNYLTIKGVRNNNGYTDAGSVWVDHRVNVELGQDQGLDDCITITRETLVDSHFEVRPLRVNLTGKNYVGACVFLPRYNGKQISESKDDGVNQNWIAIENNDGTRYQDITQYCANGKRKYFTTDLIKDLHLNNPDLDENGSEKVIPLGNNDCIWIYIDEYTTSGATSVREAQIELRFYKSATQYDSEIYTIRQKPLLYTGEYYIESYEEYLHSYDSEDKYNLETSAKDYTQNGIVWGLSGEKLSKDILVSTIELYGLGSIDVRNAISQRYDYISDSDGQNIPYIKSGNSWTSQGFESGLEFTNRASANTMMTITDMGTVPSSAYQYCLSKNKFKKDADGKHSMDIHWYLPDVSELNGILNADLQTDTDIVSDAFYWSSQPSYTQSGLEDLPLVEEFIEENPSIVDFLKERGVDLTNLGVKDEVVSSARVVSKSSGIGDKERTDNHRVRCLYSYSGVENVNMENRAPDGIGPKVIHMRARRRDTGGAGYFAQYVPSSPTKVDPKTTKEFEGDDDDYVYPTVGTLADRSFESDPMQNWVKTIKVEGDNLYPDENQFTLGRYPGLSAKVIGDRKISQDGLFTYYHTIDETSEWKSDTEIVESVTKKEVNYSNLGDNELTLNKLDGTNGIFSIAFSIGNNTKNYPKYYYYEETGKVTETWTRHWMVPEYLSSEDQYDQTLPGKNFTASGIVGRAGLYYDDLFNKWRVATTNAFTTRYNNQDNAKAAALNDAIKNAKADIDSQVETIRSENQYDSNPSIDYHESDARQNAPTPKVERSGKYYGVTYTITMDATVIFTKTGTRTVWKYSANTGRWYNEEDEEWPSMESDDNTWPNFYKKDEAPNPKVTNDELTFYSGNSFTISVDQGYVIGGVKVHFSGSNSISRTDTYLRFVPEGYNSSTGHPERMSFVDGDSGYAEWGTQEGCSQVTLQLSEATLTEPSWWQQLFGQKATINYKTDNLSYTGESVIIEKIEITYMSASN